MRFEQASCRRFFRSPFHCKWKGERWSFRKWYCFWGFICVWIFFVSFLLFLLSQKKKQEKPDGKRKKKKGFLGHACRLIKFPCVKRGEFYLLSCVTCGHSTSANSAGPNHSLRICWSEEMVGGNCSFSTDPVGEDIILPLICEWFFVADDISFHTAIRKEKDEEFWQFLAFLYMKSTYCAVFYPNRFFTNPFISV